MFTTELQARDFDFLVSSDSDTHSALSSKYIVPQNGWAAWAGGWGN